jgi:hypothetical protein
MHDKRLVLTPNFAIARRVECRPESKRATLPVSIGTALAKTARARLQPQMKKSVPAAKRKEAAPAGRPPGLQIPYSPRMVSPQGNPFGENLC